MFTFILIENKAYILLLFGSLFRLPFFLLLKKILVCILVHEEIGPALWKFSNSRFLIKRRSLRDVATMTSAFGSVVRRCLVPGFG